MAETYLGYRPGDEDTPWGKYFNPQMGELPRHAVIALEHGPQAGSIDRAHQLPLMAPVTDDQTL